MKKHIITIAGIPGSGKSATATGVARALGYEHFSSGDLFRKMAADRGVSIEEMNLVAEKQKEIDHSVDELLLKMGKEKNDLVIDSRTAFHWIPGSFRVFLQLDPEVAARRTFENIRKHGRVSQVASSLDQVLLNTLSRIESEKKRYQELYGIDFTDMKNYDLVVDSGSNDLHEVIKIVTDAYRSWLGATDPVPDP